MLWAAALHLQEQYSSRKTTIEGTAGGLSPKHWIWERGAPSQVPKTLSVCYFSSVFLLQEELCKDVETDSFIQF